MVLALVVTRRLSKTQFRNRFSTFVSCSGTTTTPLTRSSEVSVLKNLTPSSTSVTRNHRKFSVSSLSLVSPIRGRSHMMASETETEQQALENREKCVFCKIADGKEGNEIFYQDEEVVVFQDIKPAAKHHLLVVTREHLRDSKSLTPSQLPLAKRLVDVGKKVLLSQMKKEKPELECLPEDLNILMGYHWPPFHSVLHLHLHVIAPSDQMGFVARTIFRPNSFWFVTPEYVHDRLEKMAAENKVT